MNDDLDVSAGVWRFKKTGSKFVMYRKGILSNVDITKDGHILALCKEVERLNEIIREKQAFELDRAAFELSKI